MFDSCGCVHEYHLKSLSTLVLENLENPDHLSFILLNVSRSCFLIMEVYSGENWNHVIHKWI